MKVADFWVYASCCQVKVRRRSRDAYGSDDGGRKYLWNFGNFLLGIARRNPQKSAVFIHFSAGA
jgi:hypothetical protein